MLRKIYSVCPSLSLKLNNAAENNASLNFIDLINWFEQRLQGYQCLNMT